MTGIHVGPRRFLWSILRPTHWSVLSFTSGQLESAALRMPLWTKGDNINVVFSLPSRPSLMFSRSAKRRTIYSPTVWSNVYIVTLGHHLQHGSITTDEPITALPSLVLLCLGSSLKQDLEYPGNLCRSGDFFMSTNDHASLKPTDYFRHMWDLFRTLTPISPRQLEDKEIFVSPYLRYCSHYFLVRDAVKPPLTPAYGGLYPVTNKSDKTIGIEINGTHNPFSLDSITPLNLEAPIRGLIMGLRIRPTFLLHIL